MAASETSLCGRCQVLIKNSDKFLKCDGFCERNYHLKCESVLVKEYDMIKKLSSKVLWFCVSCSTRYEGQEESTCEEESTDHNRMLQKLFNVVKSLITDNQIIKSKLDCVLNHVLPETKPKEVNPNLCHPSLEVGLSVNDLTDSHSELLTKDNVAVTCNYSDKSYADAVNKPKIASKLNAAHDKVGLGSLGTKTSDVHLVDAYSTVKNQSQLQTKKKANNNHTNRQSSDTSKNRSKRFITGNLSSPSSGHNLKIAEKTVFLFISRLIPTTKAEDISNFLKIHYQSDKFEIEQLNSRYPDKYSSFKVGLPSVHLKDIFKPDFWPMGVFVSRFVNKRLKPIGQTSNLEPNVTNSAASNKPSTDLPLNLDKSVFLGFPSPVK